jgi:hypothetical protein
MANTNAAGIQNLGDGGPDGTSILDSASEKFHLLASGTAVVQQTNSTFTTTLAATTTTTATTTALQADIDAVRTRINNLTIALNNYGWTST